MRRVSAVFFALLLLAATSSRVSAQQSVYMLVDQITGDQPAPHVGEFKLNSFSAAASANLTTMGGATGAATGKATFPAVKVSMRFPPSSSASFYKIIAAGTKLPSIEIRLYTGTRMFYKTVFENAFLTSVSTEAADEALQQVEFVYSKVRWFASPDAAGLNPPVQVGCWDVTSAKIC